MAPELVARAAALIAAGKARDQRIATAESCTGGLVAALLTEVAGSSEVFERGFVTYSNEAKSECLFVPADLIDRHGAVSEPVARAMAEGALLAARVDAAVAVTGVAGPGGGSVAKPVGLVHFGLALRNRSTIHLERRYGDLGRAAIREAAVSDALRLLENALAD